MQALQMALRSSMYHASRVMGTPKIAVLSKPFDRRPAFAFGMASSQIDVIQMQSHPCERTSKSSMGQNLDAKVS